MEMLYSLGKGVRFPGQLKLDDPTQCRRRYRSNPVNESTRSAERMRRASARSGVQARLLISELPLGQVVYESCLFMA